MPRSKMKSDVILHVVTALVVALGASLSAQPPDFSGTWALDRARSRIAADAPLAGLIAAGAPDRLHVTQPANGTLVIESEVNEGHVRIYDPRTATSTPVFFQGGTITMRSRWDGGALVGEGRQESPSGATTVVREVKERIALDGSRRTLTIEVTVAGSTGAASASTLVYERTQDVGPCQTWSTPCKGRP